MYTVCPKMRPEIILRTSPGILSRTSSGIYHKIPPRFFKVFLEELFKQFNQKLINEFFQEFIIFSPRIPAAMLPKINGIFKNYFPRIPVAYFLGTSSQILLRNFRKFFPGFLRSFLQGLFRFFLRFIKKIFLEYLKKNKDSSKHLFWICLMISTVALIILSSEIS